MRHASYLASLVLLSVVPSSGAESARPKTDVVGSQLVSDVTACRKIADSGARLACYDGSVAKLSDASDKKDVVVLDREDVRKTKRSLFGYVLPHLPFFDSDNGGQDKAAREEFTEIESKIDGTHQNAAGDWILTLDDHSVWQTSEAPKSDPRAGDTIRIRKAALGSYFGNIAGQRAVRVHRIQ
jgi:hypothetical protein